MSMIPWKAIWHLTCDYPRPERRATMELCPPKGQSQSIMNRCLGKGALARRSRSLSTWPVLFLCVCLACVRPSGVVQGPDASSSSNSPELPFHSARSTNSAPAGDASAPALPPNSNPSDTLPFRPGTHPPSAERGTLLTVELGTSLVPTRIHPGDVFPATVAETVTIDGGTLIDAGTAVSGRVEAAQAAAPSVGLRGEKARLLRAGYVRLTLTAMLVNGKTIALQTSSLFARASLPHSTKRSSVDPYSSLTASLYNVPRGRRLTFRLTAPLTLDQGSPLATRQFPEQTKERARE